MASLMRLYSDNGRNMYLLRMLVFATLGVVIAAAAGPPHPARAQQPAAPTMTPPYKITPLLREPITGEPNKEAVMLLVDWPPSVSSGLHTHPGDEYATVLEGSIIGQKQGADPQTFTAGQAYHNEAGVVHEAKNGDKGARTINVLVVEKGKPLVQPVASQ